MNPDLRLVDLFAALEKATSRAETVQRATQITAALRTASPDAVRALRERLLEALSRLGCSEDPADAFLLGIIVMTLERIPAESDLAERQCPRCHGRAGSLHVMLRPLNRFERRVCTQCLGRPEAAGWHRVTTDAIDLRCHACSQMAKPTHVIALVPAPLEATVCDDCADALHALGWRAAVTRSFV